MTPLNDFMKAVGGAALCNTPTLWNTYNMARAALAVPGDFVECGVFCGTQPAIMARVLMESGAEILGRKVHLFDSFQGIPQAGPNDDESITALIGKGDGSLVTTGIDICPANIVRRNLDNWGLPGGIFVFHEGWFQETVPKVGILPIALLRLDGDLYESTKVCLEGLYPRVSKGGWIIVDDYALTGCKKAVHEYLDKMNLRPSILTVEGGGGPVYWQT